MSTIFGFVVGYIAGARAGSQGWTRVEQALRDIRESDEFRNFLTVLRNHVLGTVKILNERLADQDRPLFPDIDDLAARARARAGLDRDDG